MSKTDLTARQLAKAIRPSVSVMTVTDWVRKGLPHSVVKSQRRFDLAACQAWVKANIQRVSGGNRGGGRPKKKPDEPPPLVIPEAMPARLPTGEFAGLKDSAAVLAMMEKGGDDWNANKAHTLRHTVQAAAALDELNEAAGKLVDADEIKRVWASTLQTIRTMLDGLSARVTQSVVAATPLPREAETALRKAIKDEVVRVLGDLERGDAP